MNNLPPIEKVYEAWSAIADGRVKQLTDTNFEVISSDRSKIYRVSVDPEKNLYRSTDNATFWRRYPGYPVLAVMMVQQRIPSLLDSPEKWASINWTELNRKFKRDYPQAVAFIEKERDINPLTAAENANAVLAAFSDSEAKTTPLRVLPT